MDKLSMDTLRAEIEKVLAEKGCALYDLEWDQKGSVPTLRVSVENLSGPTDLDTCSMCSDAISAMLDEKDFSDKEYMLEVSSPGAERELKTEAQIDNAVGNYVHAKLKNPADGMDSVTGYLEENTPEYVEIKYNLKGRMKKIKIDKDNLKLIRTAVKV